METSFLLNRHHTYYDGKNIKLQIYTIKDCSVKQKEYEQYQGKEIPKQIPNLGYVRILSGKSQMTVTTPVMVCPFGFNKQTGVMSLQFTNLQTDPSMNAFFEFIQKLEFQWMKFLGLSEGDSDLFISQIKYDKQERYDPNLSVKIPFKHNRYDVDIRTTDKEASVTRIYNFSKLQCDLYLDNLWKFNERYVCKWKVKKVLIL